MISLAYPSRNSRQNISVVPGKPATASAIGNPGNARTWMPAFAGVTIRGFSICGGDIRTGALALMVMIAVIASANVLAAAPLRIAYSAISGAMSSLWVAQEGGYFKREG